MKKIVQDYKSKKAEELEKQAKVLREEIAKLTAEFKVNPPKDTNLLIKKRKQLAVLLTVLQEKKYEESINR